MSKTIRFAFFVSIIFFGVALNAQIHSEAPITFIDGKMYTDMFYVKFKSHDVLPTVTGETRANGHAISTQFPEIRGVFDAFVRARKISLEDIVIRKAIPHSIPTDEVYIDRVSGNEKKLPDLSKIYLVEFPGPVDIESIIAQLKAHPEVEYSHGPVQTINFSDHTPNDPKYTDGTQWYLDSLKAPAAWAITKGSSSIKIGIIESKGVAQQDHLDLDNNIVSGGDTTPEKLHATEVAGLAGAVTDNSIGIASLGWNTKILTYTFVGGPANRSLLADKISEAVTDGAKVLNMSFGTVKSNFKKCEDIQPSSGPFYKNWNYLVVEEAIIAAIIQDGVVIVAAAGNNPESGPNFVPCVAVPYPTWPVQYSSVIGVSGSYQDGDFRDDWNYGSFVDVNAPGVNIYTTALNNGYTSANGTSFASPLVAGLAALILSIDGSRTPAQVEEILKYSTDKIGQYTYNAEGRNDFMGFGRINAYKAVTYDPPAVPQNLSITSVLFPPANTTKRPKLTWTKNTESDLAGYKIYRKTDSEPTWLVAGDVSAGGRFASFIDYDVVIFLGFGNDDEAYYKIRAYNTANAISGYTSVESIPMAILTKPALESAASKMPEEYNLGHNRPNPFNPVTSIEFALPEAGLTRLIIYDLRGREVAKLIDGKMSAGFHNVTWDASKIASGVYIYRLTSGNFVATKKMVLLK